MLFTSKIDYKFIIDWHNLMYSRSKHLTHVGFLLLQHMRHFKASRILIFVFVQQNWVRTGLGNTAPWCGFESIYVFRRHKFRHKFGCFLFILLWNLLLWINCCFRFWWDKPLCFSAWFWLSFAKTEIKIYWIRLCRTWEYNVWLTISVIFM